MTRRVFRSWGIVAVFMMAGCAGTQAPSVEPAAVSLGDVTDEGFVLNFELDLGNGNDEPLELYRTRYQLAVNGKRVHAGLRSAESVIGANARRSLVVPTVVPFEAIGADRVPDSLQYDLSGRLWYVAENRLAEILFDAGVLRPDVKYRAAGTLTFANQNPSE